MRWSTCYRYRRFRFGRRSKVPGSKSRVQELVLNEKTLQARLVVNANVGVYAQALGSAQKLPNGNFDVDSGFTEQTIEVRPNGTRTYVLDMNMPGQQYRSYIYANLYGTSSNRVHPNKATAISHNVARSQTILPKLAHLHEASVKMKAHPVAR